MKFKTGKNNLIGKQFGKLTVVYPLENSKSGKAQWLAYCECGQYKSYIGSNLLRGHTTQCGCSPKMGRVRGSQNWKSMDYQYQWTAYVVSPKGGKSGPVIGDRIVHPQTKMEPRPHNVKVSISTQQQINVVKDMPEVSQWSGPVLGCSDITGKTIKGDSQLAAFTATTL